MSTDRDSETGGGTAPRLAAAMADIRAVTDRQGPSSERSRVGRLAGAHRVHDDAPEPVEGDEPQQT